MRAYQALSLAGVIGTLLSPSCGDSGDGPSSTLPVIDAGSPDAKPAATPDAATPDAASPDAATPDAASPLLIVSTVKAQATVDLTGQEFDAPTPDGIQDATVTAVFDGAFDAVLWVSTNADGVADQNSHEWDTVVQSEPLPDLGTPFTVGSETWTVAVSSNGTTVANDAAGHVSFPAGTRTLTLSVAQTAKFVTGQAFRLYARQGATWVAGPVFTW